MSHNWIPGVCWSIIKRDLLIKHNIFFYENIKAEDQIFYIQILTCKESLIVIEASNIIYNYRVRADSIMTSPTIKYFIDHFTVCQLITDWVNKNKFNDDVINATNKIKSRIYQSALGIYHNFPEDNRKQVQHYITQDILDFVNQYLGTNYSFNHS
ncbi:hypothetical protein ACWIYZ_08320 [Ursidibacter arcticus]